MSEANYSGDPETFHPLWRTIAQNDSDLLIPDPRRTFANAKTSRMTIEVRNANAKTSRMTHYGFASKCRARHAFLGRSMIEMLGVLAIIAVLSVAGIAGFSKAMEEYKINQAIKTHEELFYVMLKNNEQIQKGGERNITVDILNSLGLPPEGWYMVDNFNMRDTADNPVSMIASKGYTGKNQTVIRVSLNKKHPSFSKKFCRKYMYDYIQPKHEHVNALWLGLGSTVHRIYFGDKGCVDGCIRDITFAKTVEFCDLCAQTAVNGWCGFTVVMY